MSGYLALLLLACLAPAATGFSLGMAAVRPAATATSHHQQAVTKSRRQVLQTALTGAAACLVAPAAALAKPDCMQDCMRNCIRVAPGSKDYCQDQCTDYCAQEDRQDGLSGSVGDEAGEVGWASGWTGGATVTYGNDKPPDSPLPGPLKELVTPKKTQ